MQKRHSKQRKESSGKGNDEFRVVNILDEIIERKKINKKSKPTNQKKPQTNKKKHELLIEDQ